MLSRGFIGVNGVSLLFMWTRWHHIKSQPSTEKVALETVVRALNCFLAESLKLNVISLQTACPFNGNVNPLESSCLEEPCARQYS